MNNKKIVTIRKSVLATKNNRFNNYIYDRCAVFLFAIIFSVSSVFFNKDSVMTKISAFVTVMMLFFGYFLYELFAEYYFGRTLGKLITKTKVVTIEGEKPKFTAILVRTIVRFLPFEPFSFFWKFSIGWHDLISDTVVVKITATKQDVLDCEF